MEMPQDERRNENHDWTRPGVDTVAVGIHRVPLPLPQDGLRAVNVYVIEQSDGLVMVDSGWALDISEKLLADALFDLGYRLGDIRRFLITHIHRDHYGQASALRDRFGWHVMLGSGERPSLNELNTNPDQIMRQELQVLARSGAAPMVQALAGQRFHGELDLREWGTPDQWLQPYEQISLNDRFLVAVPTPGHTQGHNVFHDEANAMIFTGDHVLPGITPAIGFEPVRGHLPLRSYLDSLALVLSRPDGQMLPAHGFPAPSVHIRARELMEHHRARLAEMFGAVAAGAANAYDVARSLPWTRRGRDFADLDDFNQLLAVLETDSHLRLLAADNRLDLFDDEVVHFAPRLESVGSEDVVTGSTT